MNWQELRVKMLQVTKKAVAAAVNEDNLIMQTINSIEDIEKSANLLVRRLRDWYELYSPEFSRSIADNEAFARLILEKTRPEQFTELQVTLSMGADLPQEDVAEILSLAELIKTMYEERTRLETYLEIITKKYCPNLVAVAGATIGSKILREAGSLKRLATIQASTIQLYGAEKALFRHLKTGARPPKHGHIINHPLVAKAGPKDKGRIARAVADKIGLACRIDYFKGEFIGDELRKGLEARFQ